VNSGRTEEWQFGIKKKESAEKICEILFTRPSKIRDEDFETPFGAMR